MVSVLRGDMIKHLVSAVFALLLTATSAAAQSCTGQFQPGQICGNPTSSRAAPIATSTPTLGVPGTTSGSLAISSSAGGTVTILPPAVGGDTTIQLPTSGGTIATSGTSPIVLGADGSISCPTCAAGGSVNSVGLALPVSIFAVSGTPVTTSGTLTGTRQKPECKPTFCWTWKWGSGSADIPGAGRRRSSGYQPRQQFCWRCHGEPSDRQP